MFGLFGRKKQETVMDHFIKTIYGDPPPPKRAKLGEAIKLAQELLMGVVSERDITFVATELSSGPIPYSTHDLAASTALKFFNDPEWIPRLRTAQLMARMTMLGWLEDQKVAPLLAESFENVLYKKYKG